MPTSSEIPNESAMSETDLAVHFDLNVLNPARLRLLPFNKPGLPTNAFEGVPRRRVRPEQVALLP